MPSPLQRRSRSPTPVLNLPPANDKVWNVVRNYDLYTSSTPTLPSKESHDKYLDQSKSEQKKVLCNTKTVGDIYTEQKLNILRSQTLTSDHRGQPPKPPGDHGNFAKPLPEIEKMRTGRHLKYIAQRSTRRANGMNGASGAMNGASNLPIHAGQQMDLNFIYTKVLELSDQLKANREQTQGLIAGAEELAVSVSLWWNVFGLLRRP